MHIDWFFRLDDSAASAAVEAFFGDYGIESSIHTFIETLRQYLCLNVVIFMQIQGCIFVTLLGISWLWAARRRKSFANLTKPPVESPSKTSTPKGSSCSPPVSLIIPVKGVHRQSLENWRSLLSTTYDGELELLFVVDSEGDPAVQTLQVLKSEQVEERRRSIVVHVAAQATHCSQKIANQMAGVRASRAQSKYVLFLDDDIQLHPGSIQVLVDAMLEDSKVLVATGYPLDIPPVDSSMGTYCTMVYHLPLLVAFSHGTHAVHVWGGCMMLPLKEMRADSYGIMSAFQEGGYSDDLILASLCGARGRIVACPARAIFLNHMDPDWGFTKYWNYLRRQIFVLFTFTSFHNFMVNSVMLVVHCYISLGVTLPLLSSTAHLMLAVAEMVYPPCRHGYHLLKEVLILPTVHEYKVPAGSWISSPQCVSGAVSAMGYMLAVILSSCAARHMVLTFADICTALSPDRPPMQARQIRWSKVFWAFFLNNAVLPVCAVFTGLYGRVEW
eukprot:CAMPEP_0196576844 /NCGR_PEP_ID=MMETSP1081-20130531/6013_1 /TAXON_ID=36882 /ORGANISM="Pyramimonas amylifera, Strain CCMP720" /LENGTH=499 /DNA_ID=CAMNT_0041895561 /DNA_START=244 /DNA_END=1740 /DNA_ORIENTATION=-